MAIDNKTIATLGEFGLIERLFSPSEAPAGVPLGIGDDAAVLAVPRSHQMVVTTDSLVEGIHFLPDADPFLLAQKAVRVNLSDLAAMGAIPRWYLLSLSLPASTPLAWAEEFSRGLREAEADYHIALVGGDTTGSKGSIVIAITLVGSLPEGRAITRSGARPGDLLMVTGTVGDAAIGLAQEVGRLPVLAGDDLFYFKRRLQLPEPRLALGRMFQERVLARAAIDISDGLVADLGHLCLASGVGVEVDVEAIPLSQPARHLLEARGSECLNRLLTGGEDYELLLAIPEGMEGVAREVAAACETPLTRIGRFNPHAPEVKLLSHGGPITVGKPGWNHFA